MSWLSLGPAKPATMISSLATGTAMLILLAGCGSGEQANLVAASDITPQPTPTPTIVDVPTTAPLDVASQPTPEPTSAGFPEVPTLTPVPTPEPVPDTDVALGEGVSSDDLADADADADGGTEASSAVDVSSDDGADLGADATTSQDAGGAVDADIPADDGDSQDNAPGQDGTDNSPAVEPTSQDQGPQADADPPDESEPTSTPVPTRPALSGNALEAAISNGAEVYQVTCVRCHAADGVGSFMGPRLLAISSSYTQLTLEQELAYGHSVTFGFADKLSAEEIEAVAAYVRATL